MTLPNKIKLMALVPVLFLILAASYGIVISSIGYYQTDALQKSLTTYRALEKVRTNIGRENGLTALYLGSATNDYKEILSKQRDRTDMSIKESQNLITSQALLDNIGRLSLSRKNIDAKKVAMQEGVFRIYHDGLYLLANDTLDTKNKLADKDIFALIHQISQLSLATEYTELERAYIGYFLTKYTSLSPEEITLWNTLRAKSALALDSLKTSHTQVQKLLATNETKKLLHNLDGATLLVQKEVYSGKYAENAVDWFELQTQKIALLSKITWIMSEKLQHILNHALNQRLLSLIASVLLLMLGFALGYLWYNTHQKMLQNIQLLGTVLKKTVAQMRSHDAHLPEEANLIDTTNLETLEGMKKAYWYIEKGIESIDTLLSVQATKLIANETPFAEPVIEKVVEDEILPLETQNEKETVDLLLKEGPFSVEETAPENETIPLQVEKKILIAETLPLSSKILSKILTNLAYAHDTLEDANMLEERLNSGQYDIVFIDSELLTDAIATHYKDIAIIALTHKNEKEKVTTLKGETIFNSVTKETIESIIQAYR